MFFAISSNRAWHSRASSSRITWSAGNALTFASSRPDSTSRLRAAAISLFVLGSRGQIDPDGASRSVLPGISEQPVDRIDESLDLLRTHRSSRIQVAENAIQTIIRSPSMPVLIEMSGSGRFVRRPVEVRAVRAARASLPAG